MDIQQIKYFSRVYEMRSFTQAADSLFISRQALRKSVARLAQEMGEPLFENRGNVLFPTSAADLLFSASRPVVSAFAQMEAELNLGKLKSQGIVRFGQSVEASDVMTSSEMRQVIDFSSTSELVTKGMRFTEANCVELRQQILEGDLDYASLIATVVTSPSLITTRPLGDASTSPSVLMIPLLRKASYVSRIWKDAPSPLKELDSMCMIAWWRRPKSAVSSLTLCARVRVCTIGSKWCKPG